MKITCSVSTICTPNSPVLTPKKSSKFTIITITNTFLFIYSNGTFNAVQVMIENSQEQQPPRRNTFLLTFFIEKNVKKAWGLRAIKKATVAAETLWMVTLLDKRKIKSYRNNVNIVFDGYNNINIIRIGFISLIKILKH
jgi:hypothetical protein